MTIDFNTIISFLVSEELQARLFFVKIGFFAISGILLGIMIYMILTSHYLQWSLTNNVWEFFTFRSFGTKRITKQWNRIIKRLDTGLESEYKLAVIEADDMLELSLKRMGHAGENLEERLNKLNKVILPNIIDVYEAHRMRNNIVHNPDFRLDLDEAKKTLNVYNKAFDGLQILT